MSIRDARYLQYFSDCLGLSEVDLSEVIGVSDEGQLLFGGSGFKDAVDAGSVMLINGHTLSARIGGILRALDLNERIQTVDEVLKYSEEGYGEMQGRCFCCRSVYKEDVGTARKAQNHHSQEH